MAYQQYKYSFKNQFRTMASLTVYRTGRQQCASGYSRGQEVRDFYLIHYVIKGCGVYTLNGTSYPVQEGQTFLIYPNMPINYQADETDPWEYCWVGFNGTDARILMNATGFSPQTPVISVKRPNMMLDLLLDIYNARGNLPHEIITMTAKLYSLLAFLIEESTGALPSRARSGTEHVQRACDYIAAHYADPISVEDIAIHLGICRSHLYRIFKQYTAMSPQKYLTEFRIRQACNFMAKRHMSVKEVAYSVGFDDPLYFSTVFKASIGKTPSQYIALLQAKMEEPDAPSKKPENVQEER